MKEEKEGETVGEEDAEQQGKREKTGDKMKK